MLKTNQDYVNVHRKITSQVSWQIACKKLAAATLRTMKRLETWLLKEWADLRIATPEYLEYVSKLVKLWEHYAKKDEQGNPLKEYDENSGKETGFKISKKSRKIYEDEIKKLNEEYKEAIKNAKGQDKDYEEWLEKDATSSVAFDQIKLDDLPDNISWMALEHVSDLVEDLYINL